MSKKIFGIMAFALLCCFFLSNPADVQAAEAKAEQVAYVDTTAKALVLKFTNYASTYGYKVVDVTDSKNNKTVKEDSIASSNTATRTLSVALGTSYVEDHRYIVTVTGNDKKVLNAYYYTGTAVSGLKASKNSDESLKAAWSVSKAGTYNGYKLRLFNGADSVTPMVDTNVTPGTANSKNIGTDSLTNCAYNMYLIGYKTIDNITYNGQGLLTNYEYVKKPGKVTGLKAVPNSERVKLSWNAVSGVSSYTIYMSKKSASGYTVAAKNVTTTDYTITGLTGGKKYYFKVAAVSTAGGTNQVGSRSATANAKVPVVAGQVKQVKLTLDSSKKLALTWARTTKATGYRIYYKEESQLAYKKLGGTKNKIYSLKKLDVSKKYNVVVYAYTKTGGKTYLSAKPSKVITFTPSTYMDKNYNKLLANSVRTIGYVGNKAIYTKKKYSTAVKAAFVNSKGFSSQTDYLIWISHYTQQVTIFKGSKGKWKQIRTFTVATGKGTTHSPIGYNYKISYKETGWFYSSTKELYVSHWAGRNSFHTRPLWNNGSVQNPTIGKPASHGCVRCYNADAKYIYDNMPINTRVVSY